MVFVLYCSRLFVSLHQNTNLNNKYYGTDIINYHWMFSWLLCWHFGMLGIEWGGLLGQLGTAIIGAVVILWVANMLK